MYIPVNQQNLGVHLREKCIYAGLECILGKCTCIYTKKYAGSSKMLTMVTRQKPSHISMTFSNQHTNANVCRYRLFPLCFLLIYELQLLVCVTEPMFIYHRKTLDVQCSCWSLPYHLTSSTTYHGRMCNFRYSESATLSPTQCWYVWKEKE